MRKSSPELGILFCNIWYHADWYKKQDLFTFNKNLPKMEQLRGKMHPNISLDTTKSIFFLFKTFSKYWVIETLVNNVQINPFIAP